MSMNSRMHLREEVVWVCRRLAEKGLVAASDGNVSCRLDSNYVLITPGGRHKGDLECADLLVLDETGMPVEGPGTPSSELRMHLCVYENRPDVEAVVHAHPPMLTALTLAGLPFCAELLPEVWLTIGPVPTAPYATPSTREVPDAVRGLIGGHEALLLERHGSLTVGRTVREACMRLEKLEHAAHIQFYAHLLKNGPPDPLRTEDLLKLQALKKQ